MCIDGASPGPLCEHEPVTPALAYWIAGFGRSGAFSLLAPLHYLLLPVTFLLRLPLLGLIRFYKKFLSPLLPPACRFEPTCSIYAHQALEQHGLIKGGLLGAYRLLRCQPFGTPGYDPVPSITPAPQKEDEE